MKTVLYWLASLTWGGIMTWIGLLIAVILSPIWLIKKRKPQVFGHSIYFEIGKGWGGVNFGAIFFVNKGATTSIKCHEYGHSFQNICWGVLFPFVIAIPSAYRYWLRKFNKKNLFSVLAFAVIDIVMFGVFLIGIFYHIIALNIISVLIVLYFFVLTLWAIIIENHRYATNAFVPYDNIWFEGQATRWGLAHYL